MLIRAASVYHRPGWRWSSVPACIGRVRFHGRSRADGLGNELPSHTSVPRGGCKRVYSTACCCTTKVSWTRCTTGAAWLVLHDGVTMACKHADCAHHRMHSACTRAQPHPAAGHATLPAVPELASCSSPAAAPCCSQGRSRPQGFRSHVQAARHRGAAGSAGRLASRGALVQQSTLAPTDVSPDATTAASRLQTSLLQRAATTAVVGRAGGPAGARAPTGTAAGARHLGCHRRRMHDVAFREAGWGGGEAPGMHRQTHRPPSGPRRPRCNPVAFHRSPARTQARTAGALAR